MLPGGFVNGSEKTNGAMFAGEVVEEVGEGAHGGDGDDADPHDKSVVHEGIIA